ncbi:hypothetical protein G7Z17_g1032 [Cylindrodendrum hubeiense]|uniref:Uncharacterized protein n=1 Tax=Cylindrodendrum hubeiense TaxID=595255 RepID=A0A9P5LMH4_9HYPO|nr:hypothetical protein G7Z17_g1032 [Cylindrodendrum hubeiense]
MGRFISKQPEYSKTIVILEWESGAQTTSPRFQFWTLDYTNSAQLRPLPIPVAAPDRINELEPRQSKTETDGQKSRIHLPPLLAYDTVSSSITIHNLLAGENVDVDFSRWGPGIHLSEVQPMQRLFEGAPSGLSDAKYFSPIGSIESETWQDSTDRHSSSGLFTAIAIDNGDGTVDIKYRMKKLGRNAFSPLRTAEAYKAHEQTIRTVVRPESSDSAGWSPSPSSIPVHICSIGSRMRYLLLITVCQNKAKTKNLLSLHMMSDQMAFSEASSMTEPNEDRGLRWQLQTFELPLHVSNVSPVVLNIDRIAYLFIFYFVDGALHYARMKYAGSGSFTDFVDKIPCFASAVEEPRKSAHTQVTSTITRSRWSLLPSMSSRAEDTHSTLSVDQDGKEPHGEPLPSAADGSQPYLLTTSRSIWIFYEGRDKDAKYVRHQVPSDVDNFGDGWEAASWPAKPHTADAPRHFIPVVVAGDFMAMR